MTSTKKSLTAFSKLPVCLSSSNPSITTFLHMYNHTIQLCLLYGSQCWGMFDTDSAACKKRNEYILEKSLFSRYYIKN